MLDALSTNLNMTSHGNRDDCVPYFPFRKEETQLPPPRGFSLEATTILYLKQPLTPAQQKIIATYRTANHRIAIEN